MYKIGDKVKCDNVDPRVQRYGYSNGDLGLLEIGKEYTVTLVEPHSWHTKIELEGVKGQFNSCLFEEVNNGN